MFLRIFKPQITLNNADNRGIIYMEDVTIFYLSMAVIYFIYSYNEHFRIVNTN